MIGYERWSGKMWFVMVSCRWNGRLFLGWILGVLRFLGMGYCDFVKLGFEMYVLLGEEV